MSALIIYNVDLDKLEDQRLRLASAVWTMEDELSIAQSNPDCESSYTRRECDALNGILNMLDSWSDERAADSREVAT